jgi:hypothetical protein
METTSNFKWRSIGIQTGCESGDAISNIIEDLEVICEALISDIVDNNIRNQVDKISENDYYDAIDEIMPITVEENIKNKYKSEITYVTCFLILVMSVRSRRRDVSSPSFRTSIFYGGVRN